MVDLQIVDRPLSSFHRFTLYAPSLSVLEVAGKSKLTLSVSNTSTASFISQSNTKVYHKIPKNLLHPRRTKLPPDLGMNTLLKMRNPRTDPSENDLTHNEESDSNDESSAVAVFEDENSGAREEENVVWNADELESISSLFQGRIFQNFGKLNRERPLPLPLPHKLRPLGFPTSKNHARKSLSFRMPLSKQLHRNPEFLISIAREIQSLPSDKKVSAVLNKVAPFLRKGSLSLTIRELGHMGLHERALQTFCWAQKHPLLWPDDRILASTVEVLASARELKLPTDLDKFASLAGRTVIEAMARGFVKGRSLNLARELLLVAKNHNRLLDPGIHAKLMLQLGRNPDNYPLILDLLDELGEREELNLNQQDCIALMKVCIMLQKFETVESFFNWYKQSGRNMSVAMYTTLIHSRYSEKKYREAMAVIWEMEGSDCLFDLPAYRMVIKVFVALNDLPRTSKYFSRLKEAGFSPTFDIYQDVIKVYLVSGRLAKCREACKEAEVAGFNFDQQLKLQVSQLEKGAPMA